MLGQPLREIQRARPAAVVGVVVLDLTLERRIDLGRGIGLLDAEDQWHPRLGDIPAAEDAEMTVDVRSGAQAVGVGRDGIGRASGWERVGQYVQITVGADTFKK